MYEKFSLSLPPSPPPLSQAIWKRTRLSAMSIIPTTTKNVTTPPRLGMYRWALGMSSWSTMNTIMPPRGWGGGGLELEGVWVRGGFVSEGVWVRGACGLKVVCGLEECVG